MHLVTIRLYAEDIDVYVPASVGTFYFPEKLKEFIMGRILGLDLGTNSIGWSILEAKINADGQVKKYESILDSGVRIFPEGLDPKTIGQGDKEKSKNSQRREFRQKRRQFYRKRLRKIKLLEILIENKMCPLTKEELNKWKYWDKKNTELKREFPKSVKFNEWLKLNPYELRKKGINEDITRVEFGRVLYHMIQRRGFVSSRKEKDTGAIFDGKNDKTGITETKQMLGDKSLGEYLYTIIPSKGMPYKEFKDKNGKIVRARNRYTLREMYIEEFYRLWTRQSKHLKLDKINISQKKSRFIKGSFNSKRNQLKIAKLNEKYGEKNISIKDDWIISNSSIPLMTYLAGDIWMDEDKVYYRGTNESVLFWQRPLRSQKNLLGKCRYEHQFITVNDKKIETGKSPCYLSHPEFELFRAYQFINNIEYVEEGEKKKLDHNQRDIILQLFNSKKSNFKFKVIPQKLKLTYMRFNYDDDFSVACNKTIANLKPLFPKEIWEENFNDIWHCFHFYSDNEKLFNKLKKDYNCKCETEVGISKIFLSDGYGGLSLKAIRNINPFLSKGYSLALSVLLGGVKNAFGKEKWAKYVSEHEKIENYIKHLMKDKNAEGELIEKIKVFLSQGIKEIDFGFDINDKRFRKLYHPSVDLTQTGHELKDKIPVIPNLRNPLVQRALTETRHVVNTLIKNYGQMDIIKIEMGRDLKNTSKTRREMTFTILNNQKKNDMAREKLSEFGLAHSRQNIRKYLLYKEIEEHFSPVVCPYTGKSIRINDLLGTGNVFQIEHIIPYSVSLDDSFANITLCESNFNREKGEKTPYEFYKSNSSPDIWGGAKSWEEIESRTFKLLPYNKAKRFTSKKSLDNESFISRQLNDMRYISREAKKIMEEVCDNVQVLPGRLTAELRHLWGLNNVLQPVKEIDFGVGVVDVDDDLRIPHWAVVRDDGSFVSVHKKQNRKPLLTRGYCLFSGCVDKNIFSSNAYRDINVNDLDKGKYWCKAGSQSLPEFYVYFNEKPKSTSRFVVLKGNINKGKFINDRINSSITAEGLENGKYWANLDVEKVTIVGTERPKPKKGQLALFGKIQSKHFISYNYSCPLDQEDGETWVILSLNIEDIVYTKIKKDPPNKRSNQLLLSGSVDSGGVWISDDNPDQAYATDLPLGKYWALYELNEEDFEFTPMLNEEPKPAKGEKVIEGTVWLDKQGEVRFDPKKNREDQRHHAIDAMAIACTERSFLQKLSAYNAQSRERKEGERSTRPEFDKPWDNFRLDVQTSADKILVSYFKNTKAFDKGSRFIKKDGVKHLAKMSAVRGQLHKETVFGKRTAPDGITAYHIRKPITSLADKTQVDKVVDKTIHKLIEKYLQKTFNIDVEKKYKVPANAFFDKGEYLIKLPNKNGEEIPIKKVRMREEMGNVKRLKSNINQYVNLRNNHHVMIYRDLNDELKENIVSFWDVSQRLKNNEPAYQLPEDGKEIVTTMEINDMFLIGLPKDVKIDEIEVVGQYLYRVQKLSAGDYFFRHHLASTINNEQEVIRVSSFKAWEKYNPIKIKVDLRGKLIYDKT